MQLIRLKTAFDPPRYVAVVPEAVVYIEEIREGVTDIHLRGQDRAVRVSKKFGEIAEYLEGLSEEVKP